jgi:hypothetical protein
MLNSRHQVKEVFEHLVLAITLSPPTPQPCQRDGKVDIAESFPFVGFEFAPSYLPRMFRGRFEPGWEGEPLHVAADLPQTLLPKDTGFPWRNMVDKRTALIDYAIRKSLKAI